MEVIITFYYCPRNIFITIKSNKNTHGLNKFNNECLCTAYTDDTKFFSKDIN